jgi:outer membrane protein OmpA-like peptidoglycan-associated protein
MPPSTTAATGGAAPAPEPVDAEAAPARPKRSLLFGLVAALAVGGVVAGVLVGTGGDSSDEAITVGAPSSEVDEVASTVAPPTSAAAPATTAAPPTTQAPATTAAPTTMAPTTTAPPTTEAPPTTQAGPVYPTLPDGSPEPIVAIYDGPVVRATGWVPSEEKAAQLEALALANSTDPNATIEANWSIDPSVPLNIGTRVIEMNSPRFPPGSSEVTPEHAEQLNRVAGVMNLLPNVTATVVGHADQIGNADDNYVLSEARAVSVVRYLVGQGVDPSRLSARAVGEQDLLAEDESAASLALNRRTEFIFYGLLAD